MLRGMAVRAKNLQIFRGVVLSVPIYMVNDEDLRKRGKATTGALLDEAPALENVSEGCLFGFPVSSLIDASFRAIFSFVRWRMLYSFPATGALSNDRSVKVLRLGVAFAGAVTSGIHPGRDEIETFPAHRALRRSFGKLTYRGASPAACLESFPSVLRNVNIGAAN